MLVLYQFYAEADETSAKQASVWSLGPHLVPSQAFRFVLASSSLAILSARSALE